MACKQKNVAMVLVDRANYGRLQSVAEAIQQDPAFRLTLICGGSTVLRRFYTGPTLAEQLQQDGYTVEQVWNEHDGNLPLTQAKSLGDACREYATALHRLQPDVCLLIGDRYEALGAASACVTLGIPLVHFQGGEVSGSLDERYRHAITKLADYHWPATQRAADNLVRMGERPDSVLGVGCPSSDLAANLPWHQGEHVLCQMHPDTADVGDEHARMTAVLQALEASGRNVVCLWANVDAHSDGINKAIREHKAPWLATVKNMEPEKYLRTLAGAACAVGNSSGFVRDSSYFGTPVVLVGRRQDGRECGPNVVRCECRADAIAASMLRQLEHGRYPASDLYGDGRVSERVVEALAKLPLTTTKRLAYANLGTEQVLA